MRKLIASLLFVALSLPILAQNFNQDFHSAFENDDSLSMASILHEWESQDSLSDEFIVAKVNFLFKYGYKQSISLLPVMDTLPPNYTSQMTLTDSLGELAGYLGYFTDIDTPMVTEALRLFDRGIALYPDRIDICFGKLHLLRTIESWEDFFHELCRDADYSYIIKNKWIAPDHKFTKKDFISSMAEYSVNFIDEYDRDVVLGHLDSLKIKWCISISQRVLNYYPKEVEFWNILYVCNVLLKNDSQALNYLETAHKVAPKDCIVLNNLEYVYESMNRFDDAIKCLKKLKKYGDPHDKEWASQRISELAAK